MVHRRMLLHAYLEDSVRFAHDRQHVPAERRRQPAGDTDIDFVL
jgi:hypothetical protein